MPPKKKADDAAKSAPPAKGKALKQPSIVGFMTAKAVPPPPLPPAAPAPPAAKKEAGQRRARSEDKKTPKKPAPKGKKNSSSSNSKKKQVVISSSDDDEDEEKTFSLIGEDDDANLAVPLPKSRKSAPTEATLLETAPILDMVVMPDSPAPVSSWAIFSRALAVWTRISFFAKPLTLTPMPAAYFLSHVISSKAPVGKSTELAKHILRGCLEVLSPKKVNDHTTYFVKAANTKEGDTFLRYVLNYVEPQVIAHEFPRRTKLRESIEESVLVGRSAADSASSSPPTSAAAAAAAAASSTEKGAQDADHDKDDELTPEARWRLSVRAFVNHLSAKQPLKWALLSEEERLRLLELFIIDVDPTSRSPLVLAADRFEEHHITLKSSLNEEIAEADAKYRETLVATLDAAEAEQAGLFDAAIQARDTAKSSANYRSHEVMYHNVHVRDRLDAGVRAVCLGRDRFKRTYWAMPLSPMLWVQHVPETAAHVEMMNATAGRGGRTTHELFGFGQWGKKRKVGVAADTNNQNDGDGDDQKLNEDTQDEEDDDDADINLLLGLGQPDEKVATPTKKVAAAEESRWGFVPYSDVPALLTQLDGRLLRERELCQAISNMGLNFFSAVANYHEKARSFDYYNFERYGPSLR